MKRLFSFMTWIMLVFTLFFVGSCTPEDDPNNGGDQPEQPVNPIIEGPDILTFTIDGVSFDMRKVQGGTYWMGDQREDENGQNYDPEAHAEETPPHQVTMSDFYIGKFEVTQKLWQAVMGNNPSASQGENLPVENVGWNAVQDFLSTLNTKASDQLPEGMQFRLPTEAQWEYAARGGNQSHGYKYSGSNEMQSVAWYGGNSEGVTHAVGLKEPNELYLYDMSGNVSEWCSDYASGKKDEIGYVKDPQTDPIGPSAKFVGNNEIHIVRGGGYDDSYNWNGRHCRVASRQKSSAASSSLGMRLVLSYSAGQPSVPGLQTDESIHVTSNSVGVRGWLISDGGSYITERGCCYGTSSDLAHNGTCVPAELTDSQDFYVIVENLQQCTKYFICTYAKNDVGIAYGEMLQFSTLDNIVINTFEVVNITSTSAKVAGEVIDDGGAPITERGFCWGASGNPTINDHHVAVGSGYGGFNTQLTDLNPNYDYYVRAYAIRNSKVSYGNAVYFMTTSSVPIVKTLYVSCSWSVYGGYEWSASGKIISDGGSSINYKKVGILVSTDPNPTFDGNNYTLEVYWENDMAGVGQTFTVEWGGLFPNTTYYFRAFAVNSIGIGYGEVIEKTMGGVPIVVTTSPVTEITSTTALCGGNVNNIGVQIRGVCWSTSPDPQPIGLYENWIEVPGSAGSFSVTITGLTPNTTYYVRAFAGGDYGWGYGENKVFTTLP